MTLHTAIDDLTARFDRFVREDVSALARHERSWFERECGSTRSIVLYGFGILGRVLLERMQCLGLPPVAVADAGLSARQTEINGIPCLAPGDAVSKFGRESVFVVAVFNQTGIRSFAQIKADLCVMGAERVSYFLPFLWKYSDVFLPYYAIDLPSKLAEQGDRVLQTFSRLSDAQSRRDYACFIYQLISPDPAITALSADSETYFPGDIVQLSRSEVFVDGGAFDGDTLSRFVARTDGKFASYIGIEPDPLSLQRLEECVAGLRPKVLGALRTVSSAIGAEEGTLSFAANGTLGSALTQAGNITVPVSRLDDLLKGVTPTFIKLDIEGAELEALSGAQSLLRASRPTLAICAYHQQDHAWRIPAMIHELNLGYRLFFRRHREYLDDVVAYAIPS